jgi:hypothetical protein
MEEAWRDHRAMLDDAWKVIGKLGGLLGWSKPDVDDFVRKYGKKMHPDPHGVSRIGVHQGTSDEAALRIQAARGLRTDRSSSGS